MLGELLESGRLTSVIDSTHPLSEVGEALRHMGGGHRRGKIVVTCRRLSRSRVAIRLEAAPCPGS
ncbi:MAG: hypothetical protein KatS3mg012_2350 [Gaiellaceae bacterium]|nr:MAG: hypothetical protein KatS3mg012_2350 [Gaiellaceae bacterium]